MSCIDLKHKTLLITGAAGFIGSNLVKRILNEIKDIKVVGIDNLNEYYDVNLKKDRLENLTKYSNFIFIKGNIADKELIKDLFTKYVPIKILAVVLAALTVFLINLN